MTQRFVLNIIKSTFGLVCLLAAVCTVAATATVKNGSWELTFDTTDGHWRELKWNGREVCKNADRIVPFNFGPEWAGGKYRLPDLFHHHAHLNPVWAKAKGQCAYVLESHNWNREESLLTMNFKINDWKAKELIRLGTEASPDIIERWLELTYVPADADHEPAIFENVNFQTPFGWNGSYFFPANRNPLFNVGKTPLEQLRKKKRAEAHFCAILPFLLENGSGLTSIFVPDGTQDLTNMQILAGENTVAVQSNFKSFGWVYPGETQKIGPAYMKVSADTLENTLRGGIWKFYDETGMKAPAARPDWLADNVIYAFHPGGSADSGWCDLGGFTAAEKEIIPRLKELGIKTIWVLPVEEGARVYDPRDYYKINSKLGSEQEYKSMIAAAHDAGIKVMQDLVPHGGRPQWGAERGNKPWELVFDKDGNALNYWCFDYANPDWRQYIANVATYYMKNFKLDGFRVDVPDGSRIPNWRTRDFPSLAKVPKNVPADWWKRELENNGGKLPPIPFLRASVCRRGGGMEILTGIRQAVKSVNPDGAVLAEVSVMPYSQAADIIYDTTICYYHLRNLMINTTPENFTQGLSRWLEQLRYSEHRDKLRMRYVESHDSLRARGYLGVGATNAATALTMFIDGVPMIYHDSDIGMGVFLKKIIGIRNALPELRRGEAEYSAVCVSAPEVLHCLRRLGNDASLALINFSPEAIPLKISIPRQALPEQKLTAWDCDRGTRIPTSAMPEERVMTMPMAPWETKVIAFRPEGAPCPVQPEPSPGFDKRISDNITADKNNWGSIVINTSAYSFRLQKDGNLSLGFKSNDGSTDLKGPFAIFDNLTDSESTRLMSSGVPSLEKFGNGYKVISEMILPVGGRIRLEYRCLPDKVEVDASVSGAPEPRHLGIAFQIEDASRWQINSAEGLIEDFFHTRHAFGIPAQSWGRAYRIQGGPAKWQARAIPPDLNDPRICIFANKGPGIALLPKDPLDPGLANITLQDRLGRSPGCYAAFFWRYRELTDQGLPEIGNGSFSLVIEPQYTALEAARDKRVYKIGDLSISNSSLGWNVATPAYSLFLPRMGGNIKALRDADGNMLLENAELYADGGFAEKSRDVAFSSQGNDIESGVQLWREDNLLKMRFTGLLKGAKTATHDVMLTPPIRFTALYTFGSDPSAFTVTWGLMCGDIPRFGHPSMGWSCNIATKGKVSFSRDGQELSCGNLTLKERSGQTSGKGGPDTVAMYGKGGHKEFSIMDINMANGFSLDNAFVNDGKLYLSWFDRTHSKLTLDKWYELSAKIEIKK